jgi:hypothetical protein
MRSYSGTIRMVDAEHNFEKLRTITELGGPR